MFLVPVPLQFALNEMQSNKLTFTPGKKFLLDNSKNKNIDIQRMKLVHD